MYPSRPPFREKFVMKKKKEEEIDRVVYEEYRYPRNERQIFETGKFKNLRFFGIAVSDFHLKI